VTELFCRLREAGLYEGPLPHRLETAVAAARRLLADA
jgi:hypothetical protein